jgi:hypothetical protein
VAVLNIGFSAREATVSSMAPMKRSAASVLSCAMCAAQSIRSRSGERSHATAQLIALRLFLGGELAYERPSSIEVGSPERFGVTAAGAFEQQSFEIVLWALFLGAWHDTSVKVPGLE